MGNKIKMLIECKNIAPLDYLKNELQSESLKIGVFADNGCGKTFISRLFRLLEKQSKLSIDENGISPTDKLLRFGTTSGKFAFKITDKNGDTKEDFSFTIQEKAIPDIPKTYYLYHTFNQDYVEENIRALNYEKDSNVQGYILGKPQIDLTEDENSLKEIVKQGTELKLQVEHEIQKYIEEKINPIQNIKRLQEYKEFLTPESILNSVDDRRQKVIKTFDELISDYNKIKSVPENLPDIQEIEKVNCDINFIRMIKEKIEKVYSLSTLADDFKQKIKNKQSFIEKGIEILNDTKEKKCPFCEQEIKDDAALLIDSYTQFLTDTESKTIKEFQGYLKDLESLVTELESLEVTASMRINSYNEYKTKYIPACEEIELKKINTGQLKESLQEIVTKITQKCQSINIPIELNDVLLSNIENQIALLNETIDENNANITGINLKKNKISDENKLIRKEICKAAYNDLADKHRVNIKNINKLRDDYQRLNSEISKKKEAEKVSKKKKVAETIKKVLNYFFSGEKYTLDENQFRLIFNKTPLEKGQVKNVLSEGEKNIIAFAYYIGDTHLKIENEDDYKKLFFIIDDPISSMDFTYVYTLCGLIRDIKQILDKLDRERFIIFTHNNDFMRILSSNNIIDKKLLLKDCQISEFNETFAVPYISHLLDVYKIARKGGKANHTTANSIRHILETLTKFQNIDVSRDSLAEYIKENIPDDKKTYTFIQDLSHGAWRSEQLPLTNDDYKDVCETIIKHIEKILPKQVEYCAKLK